MFYSAGNRRVAAALLLLAACTGCNTSASRRPLERVVLAPFENLTGNPEWDWLGQAIPSTLAMASGTADRVLLPVGREEQNPLLRATQVVQGYYTLAGDNVRLQAVLRDPQSQKTLAVYQAQGAASAAGALIGQIAAQMGIGNLPNISAAGLQAFGNALRSPSAEEQLEGLRKSLEASPEYAPAALLQSRLLLSRGGRDEAVAVLRATRAKATDPWSSVQLELLEAQISGDRQRHRAAMEAALRVNPGQTDVMRPLASLLILEGAYKPAAAWLEKAASLEPGLVENWNTLAYAHAYALEFGEARRAVDQYRKLAADDPNASDTAAEIAWMAGDFRQAEALFLEAQAKSPGFLNGMEFYRAAMARFLAGDTPGADALYRKYEESRSAAADPLLAVKHAHWLMLTGRGKEGQEKAAQIASGQSEAAARAGTLLAFTLAQEGQRDKAGEVLRAAISKVKTPAAMAAAGSVAFLAQPKASVAEWQQRANRAIQPQAGPRLRALMLYYAFLLDGHWAEAVRIGEEVLRQTEPSQADEIRMLTGLAHLQLHRKDRARQLLGRPPLPPAPGDALFSTLYFPRFRDWRKQAGL